MTRIKYIKIALNTILFIFLSGIAFSQQTCGTRYLERHFNSIQIFRNVVYTKSSPKLIAATAGIETTISKDLLMDIFMPPSTDTAKNRPVVIIAHGGGFIDVAFMGGTLLVGTKDNQDVQALCDTLAHWGYVTACIEYRTGFDALSSISVKRAVWRGAQDMSTAIRFFRKNAYRFDIDPNRVFIGGSSAGAFCALHSTFVDNNERIPESNSQPFPFVMGDLGKLHSRPVVQLNSFNPFSGNNVPGNDVDSIPNAVVSYWGAIADTSFFNGNNKAPVKMYHGTSDIVVSSQCARPFASVILTAPVTCGSEIMDRALNNRNLTHQTTIVQGEGHEFWGALNGSWISGGPNSYFYPLIDSSSSFFYEIMRPDAPQILGTSTFIPNNVINFSVANPVTSSRYCWELDGGTIISSITDGPSIQVSFSATTSLASVKCREIDQAEVVSFQTVKNLSQSGLSNDLLRSDKSIHIYPNPVENTLNVEILNSISDHSKIEVFDILGQKIISRPFNNNSFSLDVGFLESGHYFVRIESDSKSYYQQFTVSK